MYKDNVTVFNCAVLLTFGCIERIVCSIVTIIINYGSDSVCFVPLHEYVEINILQIQTN